MIAAATLTAILVAAGMLVWHWTRIRWETMPHLETQELM